MKGRSNYVCHLHLARTAEYGRMATKADTVYLREIVKFAKMTDTGDKSDLASVPETASDLGAGDVDEGKLSGDGMPALSGLLLS